MAALAMTCLVVTGCGVSNHLTGTSASDSPSATVQPSDRTTTPSTSPSSSSTITPSASNSTRPAPTSHLSSTGTKDSTVSVDEMRASSNERFSSIITRAMAHVTKTKFALMAPTLPDYSPKSRVPLSMGAVVQSSADSYSVNLQWAHSQLPINSPSLSMPPNTGDAGIIGSFGATQYPSAKTALAHLNIQQMNPHLSPPTNSKNTTVDLGHGIQGLSYSSFPGMVIWHQGDWTLEMRGLALPPFRKRRKSSRIFIRTTCLLQTECSLSSWQRMVTIHQHNGCLARWCIHALIIILRFKQQKWRYRCGCIHLNLPMAKGVLKAYTAALVGSCAGTRFTFVTASDASCMGKFFRTIHSSSAIRRRRRLIFRRVSKMNPPK